MSTKLPTTFGLLNFRSTNKCFCLLSERARASSSGDFDGLNLTPCFVTHHFFDFYLQLNIELEQSWLGGNKKLDDFVQLNLNSWITHSKQYF